MSNKTASTAISVHGTDPQNLVEKILREKIRESMYWNEECFGLNAETLMEKAVELDSYGGTVGGWKKPTHFICLVLKMLQIQPDMDIVMTYIRQDQFKYLRVLGAFYLRLVGKPVQIYTELEALYSDYRKIRRKTDSSYVVSHVDEFVDELLREEYVCDITLPRLKKRHFLEEAGQLQPRASVLQGELEAALLKEKEEQLLAEMNVAATEDIGDGSGSGAQSDAESDSGSVSSRSSRGSGSGQSDEDRHRRRRRHSHRRRHRSGSRSRSGSRDGRDGEDKDDDGSRRHKHRHGHRRRHRHRSPSSGSRRSRSREDRDRDRDRERSHRHHHHRHRHRKRSRSPSSRSRSPSRRHHRSRSPRDHKRSRHEDSDSRSSRASDREHHHRHHDHHSSSSGSSSSSSKKKSGGWKGMKKQGGGNGGRGGGGSSSGNTGPRIDPRTGKKVWSRHNPEVQEAQAMRKKLGIRLLGEQSRQ